MGEGEIKIALKRAIYKKYDRLNGVLPTAVGYGSALPKQIQHQTHR